MNDQQQWGTLPEDVLRVPMIENRNFLSSPLWHAFIFLANSIT
jgi:hypothetical protein